MSHAATIDTLDFARKLRAAPGLDQQAAEIIAQEIAHFIAENVADKSVLATKEDIARVENRLTRVEVNQRWQQWGIKLLVALVVSDIVIQLLA